MIKQPTHTPIIHQSSSFFTKIKKTTQPTNDNLSHLLAQDKTLSKYKISSIKNLQDQVAQISTICSMLSSTASKIPGAKNGMGTILTQQDIDNAKQDLDILQQAKKSIIQKIKSNNPDYKTQEEADTESLVDQQNSPGIKYLYQRGFNNNDGGERLYNNFSPKENPIQFDDGTNGSYKLHITPSKKDFDNVLKEMGLFLNGLGVCAKIPLSDHQEILDSRNEQFGKAITIYTTDPAHIKAIAIKCQGLAQKYQGVYAGPDNLLRYEKPINATNNLLHYTMDKHNNADLPYDQRLEKMEEYMGQGPIDNLTK